MIVVVETNFVLEWVLQQEQAEACKQLLQLCARSPNLSLRMPAFAVAEAGMVLERRRGERQKFLREDLQHHTREISRAKILQRFDAALRALDSELITAQADEAARWFDFRLRVLDDLEIFPVDDAMLEHTLALQHSREIEQFPDALIFASVKLHLEQQRREGNTAPAIFVSTDGKAFGTPPVLQQLRKLDCTFVNSFDNAVLRLRNSR